jgi:hypothetical protein
VQFAIGHHHFDRVTAVSANLSGRQRSSSVKYYVLNAIMCQVKKQRKRALLLNC